MLRHILEDEILRLGLHMTPQDIHTRVEEFCLLHADRIAVLVEAEETRFRAMGIHRHHEALVAILLPELESFIAS